MPQLKLEITNNIREDINFKNFFLSAHQLLAQGINCNISDCKSRTAYLQNYFVGEGEEENAFIHLEVSILEGRPEEIKKELAENLQVLLKTLLVNQNKLNIQITVQIKDIERNNYCKTVLNKG